MVRRRRWHRKLIREDPMASEPVLSIQAAGKVSSESYNQGFFVKERQNKPVSPLLNVSNRAKRKNQF